MLYYFCLCWPKVVYVGQWKHTKFQIDIPSGFAIKKLTPVQTKFDESQYIEIGRKNSEKIFNFSAEFQLNISTRFDMIIFLLLKWNDTTHRNFFFSSSQMWVFAGLMKDKVAHRMNCLFCYAEIVAHVVVVEQTDWLKKEDCFSYLISAMSPCRGWIQPRGPFVKKGLGQATLWIDRLQAPSAWSA